MARARAGSLTLHRLPSYWGGPLLIGILSWLPALFLWKGREFLGIGPTAEYIDAALRFLKLQGFTLMGCFEGAAVATALSGYLFLRGLARVRFSEQGIAFEFIPFVWRRWRWGTLQGVEIDSVGRHLEDDDFARRTLTVRGPGLFGIGTSRLTINNRAWDDYEEAEALVVAVGVPAIAHRLCRRLLDGGRPLRFSLTSAGGWVRFLVYLALTAACVYAALNDRIWNAEVLKNLLKTLGDERLLMAPVRPGLMAGAMVFALLALRRLFVPSLVVDHHNLLVIRLGWLVRRIPLARICDVQVRDNATRVRAFTDDSRKKSREVWRTELFIRNRGVLLELLRQMVEALDGAEAPAEQPAAAAENPRRPIPTTKSAPVAPAAPADLPATAPRPQSRPTDQTFVPYSPVPPQSKPTSQTPAPQSAADTPTAPAPTPANLDAAATFVARHTDLPQQADPQS